MSTSPNEVLISRLESSIERLQKAVKDVPEQRCTVNTGEGTWSVRDVVEHLGMSEKGLLSRLKAAQPRAAATDFGVDAYIQKALMDRAEKHTAPEVAQPKGRFATLAETVAALKKARQETIEHVRSLPEDLRKLTAQGPRGEIDGHQFILFMTLHMERHTLQIDDIKNHPSYLK